MREHGFSGGQAHALAVWGLLARKGWDAEILTPFTGKAPTRPPVFSLRYAIRPVSSQAAVWWLREGHNLYLRRALRRALAPGSAPALLYAQDPLSAHAALQVRRPGIDKVVLVIHFNDSQAWEWAMRGDVPEGGWMYRRMEALEHEVLPRVDALVYVSRYMQRRIVERIPEAGAVRSSIFPNFVSEPVPSPEARPGDVLSIGTLEPRKNQAYTLRVLAELHRRGLKTTATFLGGGPDRAALEQLASELRLTPFVRFLGNVANASGWLPSHRVLAHAAQLENCPVALIEGLAAGVPVVAARVGGIPELIDEGTGGFWDLASVSDGADRLQALLCEASRREAASREARARWRQCFSPEVAGAALAGLFTELLG